MANGASYKDTMYDAIEARLEKKYNLPTGGMRAIRTLGERSNANQVSSKGARTVYQVIPKTRAAFLKAYGVDAYASPEAAAEVAALHLRDDLKRYKGDWNKAVRGYNGGVRGVLDPVKETRDYEARVTGKRSITVPAGDMGATQLAPGVDIKDFEYEDLAGMAPADVGGTRRSVGPRPKPVKPSKGAVLTEKLVGGRNLVPTDRAEQTPDISVEETQEAAAVKETARLDSFTFADRLEAAAEKNWVLNQIVKGIERDSFDEDPEWRKEYIAKIDTLEKVATTPDERNRVRASTSYEDYLRIVGELEAERYRDGIINSNGTGLAFELGTALIDPVGVVATAGIGKLAQVTGKGYTLGKAALEGAGVNVGFTAALDFSGVDQQADDYAVSAGLGLVLGASLYPLVKPSGKADTTAVEAAERVRIEAETQAEAVLTEARGLAGPDAPVEIVAAKVKELNVKRDRTLIELSLADVGDENKFLTVDEDMILTADPKARQAQITKSGLEGIDDAGERAIIAEVVARAEAMDAANTVNEKGLKGKLLSAINQESTGLTMLKSSSPVLRAVARQLTESTTGAAGRRRTAAISQVVRERLYMRHLIEYEQMFSLWRQSEGIGYLEGTLKQDARRRFDRDVFYEVEARLGQKEGFRVSNNRAVADAADAWERGMKTMAEEQRYVGTLGAQRLPQNSTGYMRHVIDNRAVLRLTEPERKVVENVFAKQFMSLNEYSYVNKAGEKVVKAFDPKFSRKLAKSYLSAAKTRALGGMDVPANLMSPDAADIVSTALEGLRGLDKLEREAILGKFSRGGASFTKGRLNLRLTDPIGEGKMLGDLFKQDITSLYRGYARRASGEVALAQYGIYGTKGIDILKKAAMETGATADEIKAFEQATAEILGIPARNAVRVAGLDTVRVATSAARLGGMAFTQINETSNGIAAVGAARVMSSIAGIPKGIKEVRALARGEKVDNPFLNSIDALIGPVGTDGYQMTRMFDLPDNDVQLYNDQSVGLLGRFVRGGSHMVAVASGHRAMVGAQVRGMSEQIVRKAVKFIKTGENSIALRDMGITDEVVAALRGDLDNITKFDKRGNIVSLDLLNSKVDPAIIMDFATAIERGAGQIIQRTYAGETGAWAHNDFLKLLFQFRTFSLTSIEKQWGRNQKNYGAAISFALLMASMSFAIPIHLARLNIQMIGKSDKEKKEMMDERMTAEAFGRATLNYASMSGLLGDGLDVLAAAGQHAGIIDEDLAVAFTGGGMGRQSVSGIVPGLGMLDDLLKGTVGGQFEKLPKLLPGANLPYVTPLVNGITADDE